MDMERLKIQKSLKRVMKQKKLTYRGLSDLLNSSEATIKRRLNGDDISLQQLLEMVQVLDLTFYELIELSKSEGTEEHQFTEEQEVTLSSKIDNIFIFRYILMGKKFLEILSLLKISEAALRKVLREFERAGLAKTMPGDRIVPLVGFPFKWISRGRLEKTYTKFILQILMDRILSDVGNAGLNKKFEFMLTSELYSAFCSDLNQVYIKYRNFSQTLLTTAKASNYVVSGLLFVDQFSCWERGDSNIKI